MPGLVIFLRSLMTFLTSSLIAALPASAEGGGFAGRTVYGYVEDPGSD